MSKVLSTLRAQPSGMLASVFLKKRTVRSGDVSVKGLFRSDINHEKLDKDILLKRCSKCRND